MNDYISRDDALLHSEIIRVYSKDYGNIDVVPVEYLADIPSADVQPVKRGRWLPAKGWFMSKCSECGYELGMVLAAGYICCPKCTARMDGDTECK